jgi:hypothetical protein
MSESAPIIYATSRSGRHNGQPNACEMAVVLAGDVLAARQPDPMPERIYVGPAYW